MIKKAETIVIIVSVCVVLWLLSAIRISSKSDVWVDGYRVKCVDGYERLVCTDYAMDRYDENGNKIKCVRNK